MAIPDVKAEGNGFRLYEDLSLENPQEGPLYLELQSPEASLATYREGRWVLTVAIPRDVFREILVQSLAQRFEGDFGPMAEQVAREWREKAERSRRVREDLELSGKKGSADPGPGRPT